MTWLYANLPDGALMAGTQYLRSPLRSYDWLGCKCANISAVSHSGSTGSDGQAVGWGATVQQKQE